MDPPVAASSSRVVEALLVAAVTSGATWLVTWGATRQRLVNLEERVKTMELSATSNTASISDLREGKADRSEVAREFEHTRQLVAQGFESMTARMDRLLAIVSGRMPAA